METDGTWLYWVEQPLGSIFRMRADMTAPAEFIASGNGMIMDFRVRNGYAYWIEGGEKLSRVPVSGGTVQVIATNLSFATNLVVDDQFIYLIEADSSRISKLPLAGGTKTTIAGTKPYYGWYAMTQDNQSIYWADAAGLYKVSKSGGDQSSYNILVLQDQLATPASIAVDGQYLYWTENLLGTIKRELK
jgi:hypothetical protein